MVVLAYFKVLSTNSSGKTESNHESFVLTQPVFGSNAGGEMFCMLEWDTCVLIIPTYTGRRVFV